MKIKVDTEKKKLYVTHGTNHKVDMDLLEWEELTNSFEQEVNSDGKLRLYNGDTYQVQPLVTVMEKSTQTENYILGMTLLSGAGEEKVVGVLVATQNQLTHAFKLSVENSLDLIESYIDEYDALDSI